MTAFVFHPGLSLSFQKCHIYLTRPRGNDNASCSLEMITFIAFIFDHSIFVWWNKHAWQFGTLSILKIQPVPKTCFQLHDHPIDWFSSFTSIQIKCFFISSVQEDVWISSRPHSRPPKRKNGWLSIFIPSVSSVKRMLLQNHLFLQQELEISLRHVYYYILHPSSFDKEDWSLGIFLFHWQRCSW